jgi:hypothetical protein
LGLPKPDGIPALEDRKTHGTLAGDTKPTRSLVACISVTSSQESARVPDDPYCHAECPDQPASSGSSSDPPLGFCEALAESHAILAEKRAVAIEDNVSAGGKLPIGCPPLLAQARAPAMKRPAAVLVAPPSKRKSADQPAEAP